MACCIPVEAIMTIRIALEAEPDATGELQQRRPTENATLEIRRNNDVQVPNAVPIVNGVDENEQTVYYVIEEIAEIESETEAQVISDDEPEEPPVAVQRPAPGTTSVAVPQPEPQQEIKSESEDDIEEPSNKRVKKGGCSRSLARHQVIYCRQDTDTASSTSSEASEEKEDTKSKKDANGNEGGPDTKDEKPKTEDKGEAGEGSGMSKWIKVEEPQGNIYSNSDGSNESYYVCE